MTTSSPVQTVRRPHRARPPSLNGTNARVSIQGSHLYVNETFARRLTRFPIRRTNPRARAKPQPNSAQASFRTGSPSMPRAARGSKRRNQSHHPRQADGSQTIVIDDGDPSDSGGAGIIAQPKRAHSNPTLSGAWNASSQYEQHRFRRRGPTNRLRWVARPLLDRNVQGRRSRRSAASLDLVRWRRGAGVRELGIVALQTVSGVPPRRRASQFSALSVQDAFGNTSLRASKPRNDFRLPKTIHVSQEADHRGACVRSDVELIDLQRVHREDITVITSGRRGRASIPGRAEVGAGLQSPAWKRSTRASRAGRQFADVLGDVRDHPMPPPRAGRSVGIVTRHNEAPGSLGGPLSKRDGEIGWHRCNPSRSTLGRRQPPIVFDIFARQFERHWCPPH